MSLINYTYFAKGLTFIDNLVGSGNPETNRRNRINELCEIYEPKLLRMVMGKDFADEFLAGCAETVIPARWQALKDEICVVTTTGTGPSAVTTYESFLANYVYRMWWSLKQVNVGEGADFQDKDNAVLSYAKAREVWNTMVDKIEDLQQWLYDHQSDYANDSTIYLQEIPRETII